MRRFGVVCDDSQAREIARLAREYGLTESEVIAQLVELGLREVRTGDDRTPALGR